MTEENIFEIAAEKKYRFNYKGQIAVEDLFDLSKQELDAVYQKLHASIKSNEATLLDAKTTEDKDLEIKLSIVKYIFDKKHEKEKEALQAYQTAQKKQKIMEIISRKQDEDLANSSVDDLKKMLNEL